jgi:hypothetical protein
MNVYKIVTLSLEVIRKHYSIFVFLLLYEP